MKQILLSAHIVTLVLLLFACGGGSKTSSVQEGGDTLKMKYATNLSVVKFPDYTMVSIRNPWDTLKTLHIYLLTDKTRPVPENLPDREPGARFRETGALFYLDHKTALAAFSSSYLRTAFPEEDFPQMLTGSLHLAFAARRLVLPCSIRFSFGKAGEDSVRPRLKIPAGATCSGRFRFVSAVPSGRLRTGAKRSFRAGQSFIIC